jgi:hypothetical protein
MDAKSFQMTIQRWGAEALPILEMIRDPPTREEKSQQVPDSLRDTMKVAVYSFVKIVSLAFLVVSILTILGVRPFWYVIAALVGGGWLYFAVTGAEKLARYARERAEYMEAPGVPICRTANIDGVPMTADQRFTEQGQRYADWSKNPATDTWQSSDPWTPVWTRDKDEEPEIQRPYCQHCRHHKNVHKVLYVQDSTIRNAGWYASSDEEDEDSIKIIPTQNDLTYGDYIYACNNFA